MGRGVGVNWQGIGRTTKGDFMRRFLLALLVSVVLAGCGVDVTVTNEVAAAMPTLPAPNVTPSPVPTSVPTHTPTLTPSPSSTATPQVTPSPTLTRPPTRTPRPTATPEGQFAPLVSEPFLSSLGQLAYVENQVLWVETEPGSGNFLAVDHYVSQAQWSADGSRLLYDWSGSLRPINLNNYWVYSEDFRLYTPADQNSLSFNENIAGFPTSPAIEEPCYLREETTNLSYRFLNLSPDGSRILFAVVRNDTVNDLITLVDVEAKTHTAIIRCTEVYKTLVPFINDTTFITQTHCGSPCQVLEGYDFNGNRVWELPWSVAVQFDLSADGQTIINGGHFVPPDDPLWTITLIDFKTGSITNLVPLVDLTLPERTYFTPFVRPALSLDGNLIGFYYGGVDSYSPLYIIDQAGNLIEQWADSEVIDWRPGGGPVIRQHVGEAEYQLVYSALNGAAATLITTSSNLITVGRWSPDGQFFIYTDGDEVYLWQLGAAAPSLVYSGITKHYDLLRDFAWTPDSQRVYFTINELELWVYEVVTGEVRLIAAAEPWFSPIK